MEGADYAVLEAPFYYLQGNILVSYIERNADMFGNIPLLEVDDSSSEGEADANANAVPEVAQERESKVAQSEEDPKIKEGL